MRRIGIVVLLFAFVFASLDTPAKAQVECSRAVVFTLPGVTWEYVYGVDPDGKYDSVRPATLMSFIEDGSTASMSVRTISSRTSYASGFATIGAGSRVDASRFSGSPRGPEDVAAMNEESWADGVAVAGLSQMRLDAREAGYDAVPGALAGALDAPVTAIGNSETSIPPAAPAGYARWALLAAMDEEGIVDSAMVGPRLLERDPAAPWGLRTDLEVATRAIEEALRDECGVTFIDPGDLERVDELELALGRPLPEQRTEALQTADELLAAVLSNVDLERDLVLVVSPTSPWVEEEAHLGIAAVRGPGFEPGQTLQSASTRRAGLVTLPDVAPTILEHLGLPADPDMTGRPIFAVETGADIIEQAIDTDKESIFVENMKTPITAGFVLVQILIYAASAWLIARMLRPGEARKHDRAAKWLEFAMLGIVAFPISSYLAGLIDQHELGSPVVYLFLIAIDLVLVAATHVLLKGALNRLLALCGLTILVLFVDLLTGAGLQLNTVFGYSPVVAGRFAGLGNIAFAVLGVAGLMTGALLAQQLKSPRQGLVAAGCVFIAVIIFDGAPQLGSDVGGVLALVPCLGLTFLLLWGKKPSWKFVFVGIIAGVIAVGAFLAIDLSRPPEERTHLARLYEDVRDRGFGVMTDTVERKVSANVRLFKTSLWTYFVPPALIAIAFLMRRPRGRWERLDEIYPKVRAGLVGGLFLAALGFAVNDSGIVIPAVILSFLVPLAIMVHLRVDREVEPVEGRAG